MLKAVPEECLIEARNESVGVNDTVCLATVQESVPSLALRYETWQRLVRVTAWILKWSRLRREPKKGKLSAEELKESEFTWLRNRQKVVFFPEIEELCNKGQLDQKSRIINLDPQFDQSKRLLVVGGRLQFAQIPEEAKHRIIIPHGDPVIEKLIMHLHVNACHTGPETTLAFLRQRFWLKQGRREVKGFLRKCLTCKRWQTQPVQQKNGFASRKSTDSTTIHEHWTGLYRSTVSQSRRKFRTNYIKGLSVHFHLGRYSSSSSRIVEHYDERRFSAGLSLYG